mgnify:CR=1 FL=1
MTTIQTDNNIYTKLSISDYEAIKRQRKYGFKVDKWIVIREKNMFGIL